MRERDALALTVPELTPPERVHVHRAAGGPNPGPVVYWMQQAQRARDNPALEHALALAARWDRPTCVVVGLDASEPGVTERGFVFMLEGLREVRDALAERGVGFACRLGAPDEVALAAARGAAALVCDRGYLRHQRAWRTRVAEEAPCGVVEIEGDAVVPVEVASAKAEYMARTLRPKVQRLLERFVELPSTVAVARPWPAGTAPPGEGVGVEAELDEPHALTRRLGVDAARGA
jgi:deoxyribodipyrimidine photo-lyase